MMISTKGRYALRVMLDLAEHQPDGYVPLAAIACRQKISEKYLESILSVLSKAGMLDALRGKYSLILLDAPLLFTSGLDKICDKTVRVTSPESVRISRIMKRDGISEYEAKKRAAAQTEEERLAENADITIDNTDHFVIPKSELT